MGKRSLKILLHFCLLLVLVLLFSAGGGTTRAAADDSEGVHIKNNLKIEVLRDLGIVPGDLMLLKEFYQLRKYAPAWQLRDSGISSVVKEFISFMRAMLNAHGLNESAYPFDRLEETLKEANEDALAKADILASEMVLRMARTLSGQDATPQADTSTWPIKRAKTDIAAGLNAAVKKRRVPEFLDGLAPAVPAYAQLKQALTTYRAIEEKGGWIRVRPGVTLEPGMSDERIPLIWQRLAQEGYIPFSKDVKPNLFYEETLADAVHEFQETHGLYPDGNIGPETMRAINVPVKERIDQIRVNLSRIRQSPPDAWENIVINIPSARLSFYKNSAEVYAAPVVVGRVDRQTPLVSSELYQMVINPYWFVPESIAMKDLLPKLEEDPDYLENLGIQMRAAGSASEETSGRGLRQEPGPMNSLGRVKFNFHNRFSIYLHGTPHLELFARDDRNRSSGCIRLKQPEELAAILMKGNPAFENGRLQEKIDSMKTQYVPLPEKIPIKVLYWTVTVDNKNRVQFYNDTYGLDRVWLKYL